MRACLHFSTKESKDSVFYQIFNEDINLSENDILHYSDYHYNRLDDEAKKIFDKSGLKKGRYIVTFTRTEPNEYWDDIRYLFLKPAELEF